MNITTKNIDNNSSNGISPYMNYGVGKYKINSFEIQNSSTGAQRIRMNMESMPVNDPNFNGVEGAKGQVGRVILSSYMNPNKDSYQGMMNNFLRKVSDIADALGVRDQLNVVEAANLDEYIQKITPLLTNKFTNWVIGAEEYVTEKDGEMVTRYTLVTPNYGFVNADETKLTFDKTKTYHYKPVVIENVSTTPVDDDSTEAAGW